MRPARRAAVRRPAAAGGHRARLADAALLVLDDLSSALDAATERELWARLLDAGGRPTVLVVSHRAAALDHADQVVVVEAGRLRAVEPPSPGAAHEAWSARRGAAT